MAKKTQVKFRVVEAPRAVVPPPVIVPEPLEASAVQDVEEKRAYAFPTKVRCPKKECRTLATRRRGESRDGSQQYRVCLKPSCRTKFSVQGVPV